MPVAINAYLTTLALSSYLSTRGTAFCQHWRWGCNPHDRTDKELVGVVTLFCPFHFALSVRDLSLAHWVSLLSLPAPHPAPQLWLFLSFSVSLDSISLFNALSLWLSFLCPPRFHSLSLTYL